jgi:hypothetical protein
MQRTVSYRGFEIYIELRPTSKDMLEPWFRIDGATRDPGAAAFGTLIKVRGGPNSPLMTRSLSARLPVRSSPG